MFTEGSAYGESSNAMVNEFQEIHAAELATFDQQQPKPLKMAVLHLGGNLPLSSQMLVVHRVLPSLPSRRFAKNFGGSHYNSKFYQVVIRGYEITELPPGGIVASDAGNFCNN
jgi:hypothetical protein